MNPIPRADTQPSDPGDAVGDAVVVARLPPRVRRYVLDLAAEYLGAAADHDLPAALRHLRTFTPPRRARLGARLLEAQLDSGGPFRAAVANWLRTQYPDLAAAVLAEATRDAATGSQRPAAADPAVGPRPEASADALTAVAVLLGAPLPSPEAPTGGVSPARARRSPELPDAPDAPAGAAGRLGGPDPARRPAGVAAQEAELADLRRELDRVRGQVRQARAECAREQQHRRTEAGRLHDARAEILQLRARLADLEAQSRDRQRELERELRSLRHQLARAEESRAWGRRAQREAQASEQVRLRILLDTLSGAVRGLARELALPASDGSRPADRIAAQLAAEALADPFAALAPRGLLPDDPAALDEVLAVPGVHVIVDGYNVTKAGYPNLALEDQRSRVLTGLAGLAAQTAAEITCVFDGGNRPTGTRPVSRVRGVRVLFSEPGHIADDLIVALVRAEPPGRPVVVVTADREVIEASQRSGARAVPSTALLARLERG